MKQPNDRRFYANALRFLAIDAVEAANSGHPGMPMGMADIAEVLWRDVLVHHPKEPRWLNRDRFILSNGHGSMLLYALLHLSGYDVSIEELKQFRQLHSKTPGHPEYGETPGVETTTGPLGQGLTNAVGMALTERKLAAEFNRDKYAIIDHYTYVFVGDGDLMEGISHEACSLAGTWGLGKLIVFYDDNGISIDGQVDDWFTDDTPARFRAYHWQVIPEVDGHDPEAIATAIQAARANTTQPTLICCQTNIGFGSPNKVGTAASHGAPLGRDEVALTREQLDWPYAPFEIPDAIRQGWDASRSGKEHVSRWKTLFTRYQAEYPELAAELERRCADKLPSTCLDQATADIQCWQTQINDGEAKPLATRKASQQCLNQWAPQLPELIGGSADLSGSNGTLWQGATRLTAAHPAGNYVEYGVREFAMSAIMNGMALHRGVIPYGGTFLVFSDYARNAVRLSALMQQRVIFIYTHDSIGLGEDGPTHQPIEHITMLRATPGLQVWRPCDLIETAVAWQQALTHAGPSCLLLTRQAIAPQPRTQTQLAEIARGGYVLYDGFSTDTHPLKAIVIATGSEVELAVAAAQSYQANGVNVRVVSMPCCETFEAQPLSYRMQVLPPTITVRLAVEAGSPHTWYRYVGQHGRVLGIDRFGASAPAETLYKWVGLTSEHLIEALEALM